MLRLTKLVVMEVHLCIRLRNLAPTENAILLNSLARAQPLKVNDMNSIDWATVSTSMVTSGGVLFAAYQLWFQKRLEDHKRKLDNNSKLFDIEIDFLKEVSILNTKAQASSLGIEIKLPITEVFTSKHHELIKEFKSLHEKYSFILTTPSKKAFEALIQNLDNYASLISPYASPNSSYGGGRFFAYTNLPEEAHIEASKLMKEIEDFFLTLQKNIFNLAGR